VKDLLHKIKNSDFPTWFAGLGTVAVSLDDVEQILRVVSLIVGILTTLILFYLRIRAYQRNQKDEGE
jgi:hypothetical protein